MQMYIIVHALPLSNIYRFLVKFKIKARIVSIAQCSQRAAAIVRFKFCQQVHRIVRQLHAVYKPLHCVPEWWPE